MPLTFRQFLEDAQTTMASPSGPTSPDDEDPGTRFDTDVMDREFDISKKDSENILTQGEMLTCFRPLSQLPGQQFLAAPPIPIMVDKTYPDGSADVKVMFSMVNRRKLKHLDGKTEYNGVVSDLTTHMSKDELGKIRLGPFKSAAASGGMGGGGGMAGPPPGGPGGM